MNVFLAITFMVLLMQGKQCDSAHVAIIPNAGRSHFAEFTKLAEELHLRGHKVVMYIGEGETYAIGKPFTKFFKLSDELMRVRAELKKIHASVLDKDFDKWSKYFYFYKNQAYYCDSLISDASAFSDLKLADLVIGDSPYHCGNLIADWLNLPHVYFASTNFFLTHLFYLDNPLAYMPQTMSGLPSSMTLWDRLKNVKYYIENRLMVDRLLCPAYQIIKDKYNIKPEKTIKESLFTVDLIVYPADYIFEHAQPMPPYFKEVGYFLPSPAKPLPAELEEFMQGSGDLGVVVVAFGGNLGGIREDVIDKLSSVFSQLSTSVLWKVYPGSNPKSVSSNVKVAEWIPQNDLLGHNKTRLFLTHAGSNSMAEAGYHGRPVVCNPFFGDQHDNSQLLKEAGMGEIIDVVAFSAEEIVAVINKVLQGNSYRQNAARVSRAMRSRARTPVQEAADLVEYVQSVGHMDHLKPRGLSMPFYQVYMLDVIAVLALAVSVTVVVSVLVLGFLVRMCASKKTKTA